MHFLTTPTAIFRRPTITVYDGEIVSLSSIVSRVRYGELALLSAIITPYSKPAIYSPLSLLDVWRTTPDSRFGNLRPLSAYRTTPISTFANIGPLAPYTTIPTTRSADLQPLNVWRTTPISTFANVGPLASYTTTPTTRYAPLQPLGGFVG